MSRVVARILPASSPCVLARVVAQARLCAGDTAVLIGDRPITYQALLDESLRAAATLAAAGVTAGDVVACVAGHDLPTLVLWLAVNRLDATWMPLDASYPPARIEAMLHDARPRLLVHDDEGRAQGTPSGAVARLGRRALLSKAEPVPALPEVLGSELAYVLFTSGSSGRPKGVAMRRAVIDHLIAWHQAHPRLGRAARTLQFAPATFDVAQQELYLTLATGGTLVLPSAEEKRDPYALLARLRQVRVERIFMPYVALQALAEAVAAGGTLPVDLRDVVTAGEQLRVTPAIRALFKALPGCALHNHYGPTETHVVSAYTLHGDPDRWPELPPIGQRLPHVQWMVVDAEGVVSSHGEGELLLGGDCLAQGYLHRPELTAERFVTIDGTRWYRSGDRVRVDADGVAWWLGRLDDQLKIDGYRVEPAEIETVLSRHPAVADAVVVAATTAAGTHLVAHVVPRQLDSDDAALAATLRAYAETALAPYLVPRAFVIRPALALTASGKIDRRALASFEDAAALTWPEDGTLTEQLQALWGQLLDVVDVPVQANLFDLGARSLTVIRALTELRRHGHRSLRAVQIYEHPSVAQLAALLSPAADQAMPAAMVDKGRGDRQRAALARFGPRAGGGA